MAPNSNLLHMKKVFICALTALMVACMPKNELNESGATQLIEEHVNANGNNLVEIHTADEEVFDQFKDTKLWETKMVTPVESITWEDMGKPLIAFSPSSIAYEVKKQGTDSTVRYFRAGNIKVVSLQIHEQTKEYAKVSYLWDYENPTPFKELVRAKGPYPSQMEFKKQGDIWKVYK